MSSWDVKREFVSKVSQALASRRRGKGVVVVVVLAFVVGVCNIRFYKGWRVDVAVTVVCERIKRIVRRGGAKRTSEFNDLHNNSSSCLFMVFLW